MSVHLYITKPEQFANHTEWESLFRANGGHRRFAREVFPTLPMNGTNPDAPGGIDWHWRPTDFAAWRHAISTDPQLVDTNLLAMVDILEREPDYWLIVSQ